MTASMFKGIIVGAVVATTGGAIAGYNMMEEPAPAAPLFAEVISAVPATETIEVPREVCEEVEVTHQKELRDKHRIMGTATGALLGGLLGNQVGGGSGKTVATVAGAAAGGYAGNKVQERVQSDDVYTTVETRCDTIVEVEDRIIGYDVTYRIGDQQNQIRMDRDPGKRIPLADGVLSVEGDNAAAKTSLSS
jgi:uncharacterized protein YcfJ